MINVELRIVYCKLVVILPFTIRNFQFTIQYDWTSL